MKKFLFALILLLAIANIWVACSKDPNSTSISESISNESIASDRSGSSITIGNAFGMSLCGYLPGNSCDVCGSGLIYSPFEVDQNPTTIELPTRKFCITNKSASAQTVTFQRPGCITYSFSIPAYSTQCFSISGCVVSLGC